MQPHDAEPVLSAGQPIGSGRAAMIMIHGRNAGPENILELARLLPHPGYSFVAPSAAGGSWYPLSFMAETSRNEPGLSSGLAVIRQLVGSIEAQGVPRRRI